jgi:hypothetical protein
MDLQSAWDTLEVAGYDSVDSVDGRGRRHQIVYRNWVVIRQSAPPGSQPSTDTHVVLTVVKYGEPIGTSGC